MDLSNVFVTVNDKMYIDPDALDAWMCDLIGYSKEGEPKKKEIGAVDQVINILRNYKNLQRDFKWLEGLKNSTKSKPDSIVVLKN